MKREQEMAARRRRRIERWFKSLPPEKQKPPTKKETAKLVREGLVNKNGGLTNAGELRLLQLETLEWMANNPLDKRRAKKRKSHGDNPSSI